MIAISLKTTVEDDSPSITVFKVTKDMQRPGQQK